jgi:hypothetical protein
MSNPLAYHAAASSNSGSERRMRGRLRQQGVMSNLGVVLDLSASGMRVLSTRAESGESNILIWTESDRLALRGAVVWSKRVGFRRHLNGVRFVELDEGKVQALGSIAAAHRLRVAV